MLSAYICIEYFFDWNIYVCVKKLLFVIINVFLKDEWTVLVQLYSHVLIDAYTACL